MEPQGREGGGGDGGEENLRRFYWSATRLRMSLSSSQEMNNSYVETFVPGSYQERKPRVSFSLPVYKSFPIKVSFVTNTSIGPRAAQG